MLKFSAAAAAFLALAVFGSYGTEAGKAANAMLGQALLDQGAVANGEVPAGSIQAHR